MHDRLALTHQNSTKGYDSKMMSNSPYTKVVTCFTKSYFGSVEHIAKHNVDPFVSWYRKITKCVTLHGKRLLETSVKCYNKCHEIISSKQQLTPSSVDSIRNVMSQSFLSTILIPFIAGLSVSAPRMSLATQLLPSLLALVEIVDIVNCKLMLISSSDKEKTKKQSTFLSNLFVTKRCQ